jgi:hypothetical protein
MSNRIRGASPAPTQHNYLKKLLAITEARGGLLPTPGKSADVFVSHDKWCRALKGGICNCDPQITFRSS